MSLLSCLGGGWRNEDKRVWLFIWRWGRRRGADSTAHLLVSFDQFKSCVDVYVFLLTWTQTNITLLILVFIGFKVAAIHSRVPAVSWNMCTTRWNNLSTVFTASYIEFWFFSDFFLFLLFFVLFLLTKGCKYKEIRRCLQRDIGKLVLILILPDVISIHKQMFESNHLIKKQDFNIYFKCWKIVFTVRCRKPWLCNNN